MSAVLSPKEQVQRRILFPNAEAEAGSFHGPSEFMAREGRPWSWKSSMLHYCMCLGISDVNERQKEEVMIRPNRMVLVK